MTFLYALGDGDRVRAMIDNGLLGGNLDEAKELSQKLTCAMQILSDLVEQCPGWQVVFSGGDDICLTIEKLTYREEVIRSLMEQFHELTGGTMSFGVGTSMENAYLNLHRAKARGGNILVATQP
jgi:hypothetical protein